MYLAGNIDIWKENDCGLYRKNSKNQNMLKKQQGAFLIYNNFKIEK